MFMFQYAIHDFEHWRGLARDLRLKNTSPDAVQFLPASEPLLFAEEKTVEPGLSAGSNLLRVPRQFLELAENVSFHRSHQRWNLLYRALWRLTNDEPKLLDCVTDEDIHALRKMEKSVTRDAHKMKAFVRFREVATEDAIHFVAWHRPDHLIVRKVAPFFARRFKSMNWSILTPDESVSWDQEQLTYSAGMPRSAAPASDELESLWRTYYANIFNPARIKLKAMRAGMPLRHWPTLPETQAIDDMLKAAPQRIQTMIEHSEGFAETARHYFPPESDLGSLDALAKAAQGCRACELACHATQVVFGRGPSEAQLVIVGEQPGDQEDKAGEPFVGPAGILLNRALAQAGIDRSQTYMTNVVKHFKHEMRGKLRMHRRPHEREVRACRPWFQAEWSALSASTLVCLGVTAASALIAPGFRLQAQRGQWIKSEYCERTLATWHPASILRLPNPQMQTQRFNELVADLRTASMNGESA